MLTSVQLAKEIEAMKARLRHFRLQDPVCRTVMARKGVTFEEIIRVKEDQAVREADLKRLVGMLDYYEQLKANDRQIFPKRHDWNSRFQELKRNMVLKKIQEVCTINVKMKNILEREQRAEAKRRQQKRQNQRIRIKHNQDLKYHRKVVDDAERKRLRQIELLRQKQQHREMQRQAGETSTVSRSRMQSRTTEPNNEEIREKLDKIESRRNTGKERHANILRRIRDRIREQDSHLTKSSRSEPALDLNSTLSRSLAKLERYEKRIAAKKRDERNKFVEIRKARQSAQRIKKSVQRGRTDECGKEGARVKQLGEKLQSRHRESAELRRSKRQQRLAQVRENLQSQRSLIQKRCDDIEQRYRRLEEQSWARGREQEERRGRVMAQEIERKRVGEERARQEARLQELLGRRDRRDKLQSLFEQIAFK